MSGYFSDDGEEVAATGRLDALSKPGGAHKCGFLSKVGATPGHRLLTKFGAGRVNWKRRFFCLSEGALAYFTDDTNDADTKAQLKGGILLEHVKLIRAAASAEADRPFVFIVQTTTRKYKLQAKSETERDDWMAALHKAVGGGAAEGTVEIMVHAGATGMADPLLFFLEDIGVQHVVKPIGSADWQGLQRRLETRGLPGRLPVVTLPTGFRVDSLLVAMRHFARAYGKYGDTEEDAMLTDLAADFVAEWRADFSSVVYAPGWLKDAAAVARYCAPDGPLAGRLGQAAALLKVNSGGDYLCGTTVTFADFGLFAILDAHMQVDGACLDTHLELSSFMAAFNARSTTAAYLQIRGPGDFAETPTKLS